MISQLSRYYYTHVHAHHQLPRMVAKAKETISLSTDDICITDRYLVLFNTVKAKHNYTCLYVFNHSFELMYVEHTTKVLLNPSTLSDGANTLEFSRSTFNLDTKVWDKSSNKPISSYIGEHTLMIDEDVYVDIGRKLLIKGRDLVCYSWPYFVVRNKVYKLDAVKGELSYVCPFVSCFDINTPTILSMYSHKSVYIISECDSGSNYNCLKVYYQDGTTLAEYKGNDLLVRMNGWENKCSIMVHCNGIYECIDLEF